MKANDIAEFRSHVAQLAQASARYLYLQALEEAGPGIGGSSSIEN
jgi:hypothetical protein